jgi:very-short-patch-repair endonuclease
LRRTQTQEEKELWRALRDRRFAGFKFRRQHSSGNYFLDFYCALARLSIELDGFQHRLPEQMRFDEKRTAWLAREQIEELRFWNHQWRENREGVLLEIWHALERRAGCAQVSVQAEKQRFIPPPANVLKDRPSPQPSPRSFLAGRGNQKAFVDTGRFWRDIRCVNCSMLPWINFGQMSLFDPHNDVDSLASPE